MRYSYTLAHIYHGNGRTIHYINTFIHLLQVIESIKKATDNVENNRVVRLYGFYTIRMYTNVPYVCIYIVVYPKRGS